MEISPEYTHMQVDQNKVMKELLEIYPALILSLNHLEILTLCNAIKEMVERVETVA